MNNEMMFSLVPGKFYKVDRGGPESRIGKLIGVKVDYFTMLTEEDGLVFYQPHHVKSITQNTERGFEIDSNFPSNLKFRAPRNFKSVLKSLINFQVKVNRGGKESVEGVLEGVNDSFIKLVTEDEVVKISLFHLRNISYELIQDK